MIGLSIILLAKWRAAGSTSWLVETIWGVWGGEIYGQLCECVGQLCLHIKTMWLSKYTILLQGKRTLSSMVAEQKLLSHLYSRSYSCSV